MPPLIPLDTWNIRDEAPRRKPKGRCFIIAEGANTEYWYLSHLAKLLAKRNLPELVEMRPVERTEDDRNKSHPHALYKQASEIRYDEEGKYGFDPETDRIVVVYDLDVYKGDEAGYKADLAEIAEVADVAVTNPSFELFLLLHVEDAYERYISPHAQEILENAYAPNTHRRYISKLANDILHINVKKNQRAALLAEDFELAAAQERNLNQNPAIAMNNLSSNVGKTILEIIDSGREKPSPE